MSGKVEVTIDRSQQWGKLLSQADTISNVPLLKFRTLVGTRKDGVTTKFCRVYKVDRNEGGGLYDVVLENLSEYGSIVEGQLLLKPGEIALLYPNNHITLLGAGKMKESGEMKKSELKYIYQCVQPPVGGVPVCSDMLSLKKRLAALKQKLDQEKRFQSLMMNGMSGGKKEEGGDDPFATKTEEVGGGEECAAPGTAPGDVVLPQKKKKAVQVVPDQKMPPLHLMPNLQQLVMRVILRFQAKARGKKARREFQEKKAGIALQNAARIGRIWKAKAVLARKRREAYGKDYVRPEEVKIKSALSSSKSGGADDPFSAQQQAVGGGEESAPPGEADEYDDDFEDEKEEEEEFQMPSMEDGALDLSNKKLQAMPKDIEPSKDLTALDISNNSLSGPLTGIKTFTALTRLNVGCNKIASLPPTIKLLDKLVELTLSGNQLTTLPVELASCLKLTHLSVDENSLVSIPFELSRLTSMEHLALNSNFLPSIPEALTSKMKNLRYFDISKNLFKALPPCLVRNSQLGQLQARNNQIKTVSDKFAALKQLTVFDLSENPLDSEAAKLVESILSSNEAEIAAQTKKWPPPPAPKITKSEVVDGTAVKISWSGVKASEQFSNYEVKYCRVEDESADAEKVAKRVVYTGRGLSFKVGNLSPGDCYRFWVSSVGKGGKNAGEPVSVKLKWIPTWTHMSPKISGPSPSPRISPMYCLVGNQMVVYGGSSADAVVLNDIWRLNLDTYTWVQMGSRGKKPSARSGASCVADKSTMYVFGGTVGPHEYVRDLYSFEFEPRWTSTTDKSVPSGEWKLLSPEGDAPKKRRGASLVMLNNRLYLYGGMREGAKAATLLADMWEYDIENNRWSEITFESPSPGPRQGHAMVVVKRKMFLISGATSVNKDGTDGSSAADIWECVVKEGTATWRKFIFGSSKTWVAKQGVHIPRERTGHTACYSNNAIYVFGGMDLDDWFAMNDLWKFDVEKGNLGDYEDTGILIKEKSKNPWMHIPITGKPPFPRRRHAMVMYENGLLVFGGADANADRVEKTLGDLHRYRVGEEEGKRFKGAFKPFIHPKKNKFGSIAECQECTFAPDLGPANPNVNASSKIADMWKKGKESAWSNKPKEKVEAKKEKKALDIHSKTFVDVERSPVCMDVSNKYVAVGYTDFMVRLWNVETKELLHLLKGCGGAITSVIIAEKIVGVGGRTVCCWDPESGEAQSHDFSDQIAGAVATADSSSVFVYGESWVHQLDLTTVKPTREIKVDVTIHTVRVLGRHFLAIAGGPVILVYDTKDPEQKSPVGYTTQSPNPKIQGGNVRSLDFEPTSGTLFAGSTTGRLHHWTSIDKETFVKEKGRKEESTSYTMPDQSEEVVDVEELNGEDPPFVEFVSILSSINRLAIGMSSGEVFLRGIRSSEKEPFSGLKGTVVGLVSANNKLFGAADKSASVVVWNTEGGGLDSDNSKPLTHLKHGGPVKALCEGNGAVYSTSVDRKVKSWVAVNDEVPAHQRTYDSPTWTVSSFHIDSNILCVASTDKVLRVWNFAAMAKTRYGYHPRRCTGHAAPITCMLYDRGVAYTGSEDMTVRSWIIGTVRPKSAVASTSKKGSMSARPSTARSARSAAGSSTEKQLPFTFQGHKAAVSCLKLNNQNLFSGDVDGIVMEWNVMTGQSLRRYVGHKGGILSMLATPDIMLSIAEQDGLMKVWRLNKEKYQGTPREGDGSADVEAPKYHLGPGKDVAGGGVTCMNVITHLEGGHVIVMGTRSHSVFAYHVQTRRLLAIYERDQEPEEKRVADDKKGAIKCIHVDANLNLMFCGDEGFEDVEGKKGANAVGWTLNPLQTTIGKSHARYEKKHGQSEKPELPSTTEGQKPIKRFVKSSRVFRGHKKAILCMRSVGNVLYTSSADATVRSWNVEDCRKPLFIYRGYGLPVTQITYFNDVLYTAAENVHAERAQHLERIALGQSKRQVDEKDPADIEFKKKKIKQEVVRVRQYIRRDDPVWEGVVLDFNPVQEPEKLKGRTDCVWWYRFETASKTVKWEAGYKVAGEDAVRYLNVDLQLLVWHDAKDSDIAKFPFEERVNKHQLKVKLPMFGPDLTKAKAEERRGASFFERLEHQAGTKDARKTEKLLKAEQEIHKDCTFKPQLNLGKKNLTANVKGSFMARYQKDVNDRKLKDAQRQKQKELEEKSLLKTSKKLSKKEATKKYNRLASKPSNNSGNIADAKKAVGSAVLHHLGRAGGSSGSARIPSRKSAAGNFMPVKASEIESESEEESEEEEEEEFKESDGEDLQGSDGGGVATDNEATSSEGEVEEDDGGEAEGAEEYGEETDEEVEVDEDEEDEDTEGEGEED